MSDLQEALDVLDRHMFVSRAKAGAPDRCSDGHPDQPWPCDAVRMARLVLVLQQPGGTTMTETPALREALADLVLAIDQHALRNLRNSDSRINVAYKRARAALATADTAVPDDEAIAARLAAVEGAALIPAGQPCPICGPEGHGQHVDDSYGSCVTCREYVAHTDNVMRAVPFPCGRIVSRFFYTLVTTDTGARR